MKFAYEDLSEEKFEQLIILLCQHLLGISVQGFTRGPDGGRDAKFVGTAELHPSKASPWTGTTIIQAKHTNGHNRSFSETDFFSCRTTKTVLGKEIPRIKCLRKTEELDHYMLFANRRLSANAENEIRSYISDECNIPRESIYLCGVEQLELWLKKFKDIHRQADLDPIDSPLIVSPEELAEVVQAIARHKKEVGDILDAPPKPRVPYKEKNKINKMTPEYADEQKKFFLKETAQIQSFLSNPENTDLLHLYKDVVDEFQLKIIANRKEYQTFDKVMEYLLDLLFARDPILRQRPHKRLTRAVLFYMYWNCDIGRDRNATSD